ncbi:MAG: hydantoinase/oxoprolinase family protein [Acidimicrobiales bacterium]
MTYRVGIDTGGTFTDFIVVDDDDGSYRIHKVPSTPEDPAVSFVSGLLEIGDQLGLGQAFLAEIELVVHGTTVATNAVLTGQGADVALVTTEGFRDALQMRRGMREETLNNKLPVARPIVPRHRRFGVRERVSFGGEVLVPLDVADVHEAGRRCSEAGVQAVAVCFLHSYANPHHEEQARKILSAELPDVYVTTSHELLAQIRLYERVSTTVLNAFTGPLIHGYLARLVASLAELGFRGDLLVMQSSGGVTSPALARERSAATLLSGPAAVPVAGAVYAEPVGATSCLTMDMGGTSFDAALVPNGKPTMLANGGWINRHRVALPMLAIHTIGAGGGSLASIDRSGILRMGPASAGADPGPACYGRGGTRPTCTDANLVLGYLNPDNFLGGRIRLDVAAAEDAIRRHVAEPLGLGVAEGAAAMFRVITVNMTEGIREVSVDQGADPRDFLLVVGGGAGPVHAAMIANQLAIPRLLVPRDSAVFAAVGLLLADVRHDAVRAMPAALSTLDPEDLGAAFDDLVDDVLARMRAEGFERDDVVVAPGCDLRYRGQFHEIQLPVPFEALHEGGFVRVESLFAAEHERLYGWASEGDEVELVNLRVAATAARPKPVRPPARRHGDVDARTGERDAYLPLAGEFRPVPVFQGELLLAGARLPGPAVVELPTTTLVVPDTYVLDVTEQGDFLLAPADTT